MSAAPSSDDDPRREQILEAARSAFLANGYAYTSIDAVAQAARVSKQTIYQHFRDKADIFRHVVVRDMELFQYLPDLTADARPPEAVLLDVAHWLYEHHATPEHVAMFSMLIGAAAEFPDLVTAHDRFRASSSLGRVTEYLALLDEKGILAIDDPAGAARRFALLVTEGSRNLMGHPMTAPAERRQQHARTVGLFLRGLGAR